MKKLMSVLFLLSFLSNALVSFADEGMWTFDNPPLKLWKERYNFAPSAEWLEKVRLATVRLSSGSSGGSGSFVSPNGLLITNQHVANDSLTKISTKNKDFV